MSESQDCVLAARKEPPPTEMKGDARNGPVVESHWRQLATGCRGGEPQTQIQMWLRGSAVEGLNMPPTISLANASP